MHHLLANYESIAAGTNEPVSGLADQIFSRREGNFFPGEDYDIVAIYGQGTALDRLRIASPSVIAVQANLVFPIRVGALPQEDQKIADYRTSPLKMMGDEAFILQATTNGGAAGVYVLTWVRQRFDPAPTGDIYTLRGTATTTATANAWTDLDMTWDFELPKGDYEIIGGTAFSTTCIAFRLLLENQVMRPGGLGFATEGLCSWDGQFMGGLGKWGKFRTINLPNVQVLCSAADTAETVYLQCVRVR